MVAIMAEALRFWPSMRTSKRADNISVNCGRCGKRLQMPLAELRTKYTVDCSACAKKLPRRVLDTHAAGPHVSIRRLAQTIVLDE